MAVTIDSDRTADESVAFSAGESLFGKIRHALNGQVPVQLEHRENGAVTLWPGEGVFQATGEPLPTLCADAPGEYRIRRLRESAPPADAAVRPVEELLWATGFAASAGRLVDGLRPTDLIELTGWPNLTRVPIEDHGMRLAALFRRYPSSIPLAGRLTGASRAEVNRFLSAAWCAGLARPVNRPEAPAPNSEPARADSVIEALLRHLWG